MKKLIITIVALFLMGGSTWGQIKLGEDIDGEAAGDMSGHSISLSANGKRLAIGAPNNDGNGSNAGHVRVYNLIGGAWVQIGNDIDGEAAQDSSGYAVSLSADGNRVAIGAPGNDGNGTNAGHVRVYELVSGAWKQLGGDLDGNAASDNAGFSVALSSNGRVLATGAPSSNGRGYVRMYEWHNGTWMHMQDIKGADASQSAFSQFGYSVSFFKNLLAVGARARWATGFVKVYKYAGSWQQLGWHISGSTSSQAGYSVSLALGSYPSTDGIQVRVALGAPHAGFVATYDWIGWGWQQLGPFITKKALEDSLGNAVSLSSNGQRLLIGAYRKDGVRTGIDVGSIRLYDWDGKNWIQATGELEGESTGDFLGSSVLLSADGSTIAIGIPGKDANGRDAGSVRVFYDTGYSPEGYIRQDDNANCLADRTEPGMADIPVIFENGIERYAGPTNDKGYYKVWADTGTYTVTPDPSAYPYRTACPASQQIRVDSTQDSTIYTNFVLQTTLLCPYLTAEITAPRIRRCFAGNYTVSYCNRGTIPATNAYIEVELDPHLSYTSSSLTLTSQTGNLLRFQLGSIPVGACEKFIVRFKEDCQSERGQIHCSSVHIYPDSVCRDDVPNVKVTPRCQGNTLRYEVHNMADDFPAALPYMVVDDSVVLETGNITLSKGQKKTISYDTKGSPDLYQLIIAPENRKYYAATQLKGCKTSALSTAMIYLPKPRRDFEDIDCQENIGSFDPNDKQVIPAGRGMDHHLVPNTPLEYTIRFQNTGSDTAFFVNILDTLSEHLDLETLWPVASSHKYNMTYLKPTTAGQRILRFEFNPIHLPDSSTDQEGSNGFIKFRARMKPNLPLGTRIENKAAIYFDFNEPVITNTVFHTLHNPPGYSLSTDKFASRIPLSVYPNPTTGHLQIDLGAPYRDVELVVRNVLGQSLFSKKYDILQQTEIELDGASGLYVLEMRTGAGQSAMVKVVKR